MGIEPLPVTARAGVVAGAARVPVFVVRNLAIRAVASAVLDLGTNQLRVRVCVAGSEHPDFAGGVDNLAEAVTCLNPLEDQPPLALLLS
jgi:hypothetical protein